MFVTMPFHGNYHGKRHASLCLCVVLITGAIIVLVQCFLALEIVFSTRSPWKSPFSLFEQTRDAFSGESVSWEHQRDVIRHDVLEDTGSVAIEKDEHFLIPYLQWFNITAAKGLSVRREVLTTEFERRLLSSPPLADMTSAPDELRSRVEILSQQDAFHVGDTLQLRVDLYDGRGRIRSTGGDELRIWLTSDPSGVNASNITSVAAKVTDLQNGSYLGETTLMWPGMTYVHVSLTYAREFLRTLVELRHTLHSMRWILGTFEDGNGAHEVTACLPSAPIPGFARACNLTSRNAGISWYCGHPTDERLSCDDWVGTGNLDYTPLYSLSPVDLQLLKKVNSKPFLKLIPNNITLRTLPGNRRPKENLPPCWTRPRQDTWKSPTPRGWFDKGSWRPTSCSLPDLTSQRVRQCLRNTTMIVLGDCNMRKWWLTLRSFFDCSRVQEGMWHAPMLCEVDATNTTILFAPHAMPFNVGTHTDLHTLPLPTALQMLDPKNRNTVVAIHYYLHHFNYPINVYVDRVRAARGAIETFLRSHPEATFFIRGPHVLYDGNKHHAHFGDSFGEEYVRVWEREFESLRDKVWFLNYWDMTIAAENMSQNPTKEVDLEKLKVLFGYFCAG